MIFTVIVKKYIISLSVFVSVSKISSSYFSKNDQNYLFLLDNYNSEANFDSANMNDVMDMNIDDIIMNTNMYQNPNEETSSFEIGEDYDAEINTTRDQQSDKVTWSLPPYEYYRCGVTCPSSVRQCQGTGGGSDYCWRGFCWYPSEQCDAIIELRYQKAYEKWQKNKNVRTGNVIYQIEPPTRDQKTIFPN